MKILLLTDQMDTGGAETHLFCLAEGLAALGAEVWLLSAGGRLADRLTQIGVHTVTAPMRSHKLSDLVSSYRKLRRLIRQEQFDVLHAHARLPAFLLRFCKASQSPCLVSVHAHFYVNRLLSRLCYWGNRTVAVSEDLREYVCREYRLPSERVTVIPNGIDCTRFAPPDRDQQQNPHAILFASRLDRDSSRGAELLCSIAPTLWKSFPNLRITIAGGGEEYGRMQALAERVNVLLGKRVVCVVGRVEDMPSLMRTHGIFVGVSRAALEACASRCAVILCGNEGYGGILSSANAPKAAASNFCARGEKMPNEDLLARDLTRLLEDQALQRQYGQELRALAKEHFDADRMCRATLAEYHRLASPKKQFTVTVGGYFGCGNLGDDAILQGFLLGMHTVAPEIRVQALTGAPRRNRQRLGISCHNRKNPLSIWLAFSASRAFLCGGGSLLQNLTSRRSLSYYLTLLRTARRMKCRTLLYAAGIGPLLGARATQRTVDELQRCAYIGLRDDHSMRQLTSHGIDAALLHLGADPACLLPLPPATRAMMLMQRYGISADTPLLCVVLNGSTSPQILQNLLSAIRIVCLRRSLTPLFLIFDRRHDRYRSEQVARAYKGYACAPTDPTDAIALISVTRAVVTLRLHALIFATAAGIPAVGIAADPRDAKISAFARAVGQDALSPKSLSVPMLVETILATLDDRQHRTPMLTDAMADLRQAAEADLERVTAMLRGLP